MGLRDIGDTLPPGFRFYPSDEELVCHYLYKRLLMKKFSEVLSSKSIFMCVNHGSSLMWRNSTPTSGTSLASVIASTLRIRTNRATTSGYWKATGKDRSVVDPKTRAVVGMRKTLVFYRNRAPNGIKTGWIMHEFRLENPHVPPKEDWVLCRVFHKSRGENSNKIISPHSFYNSTGGPTSPNYFPSSPINNNMPCAHQTITSFNPSPTHHHRHPTTSLALDPAPFVDHSHYDTSPLYFPAKMVEPNNTKCEDDYGFLLDFDGSTAAVPSNLDDMRFDDDNGSVFI